MSYVLIVTPEAIAETARIYAYHKRLDQTLADRFDKALDACYRAITKTPSAYHIRKKNYRQPTLKRFRYREVFAIIGQEVVVFQVRHTSRKVSREFGP